MVVKPKTLLVFVFFGGGGMLGSHDLPMTSPGMGNGFGPVGSLAEVRPLVGELLYIREKTREWMGSL